MIVKILNELHSKNHKHQLGGWSYFECTIIHSRHTLLKDIVNIGESVQFLNPVEVKDSKTKSVKVLNLETEKSHLKTIVTDKVCYILNDQGKTVDRI
ncbi:hypothetical protein LCGC14_1001640 [marine sediment metagenome]|uniref:Uncharacterized protein n=1 Tax=marine sediment metagenome TaxID=412755 RepID=A0A0F9N2W3_9ZZZZ